MGANTTVESCSVCGTEYEYNAKFPGKEICGKSACFVSLCESRYYQAYLAAGTEGGNFLDVEKRLSGMEGFVPCDTVRQYE